MEDQSIKTSSLSVQIILPKETSSINIKKLESKSQSSGKSAEATVEKKTPSKTPSSNWVGTSSTKKKSLRLIKLDSYDVDEDSGRMTKSSKSGIEDEKRKSESTQKSKKAQLK